MKQFRDQPFLSPLGAERGIIARWRRMSERLPDSAAPIAFMVVGGVAVIALLGTLLSGVPRQPPAQETVAQAEPANPEPASAPLPAAAQEAAPEPAAVAAVPAELLRAEPDPERTASILSAVRDTSAFVPEVDVAETEEEIAALEARQQLEVEEDVGTPSPSVEEAAIVPLPQKRDATTTNYVNMRAAANDEAEVLEVVPALAEIEAQEDCDWCAVTYEGRTGYIYRTFISYR